ncbi:hypothetical protein [Streptomyces sp. NPDC046712]
MKNSSRVLLAAFALVVDFWVMLTYIAAQYLLTAGVLKAEYGERRTTD